MTGGWVNSGQRLKDRLNDKRASRYDVAGLPYVIVVGIHDPFASLDTIIDGVYGHEAVEVRTGNTTRKNDGYFGLSPDKPHGRNRGISAVVVLRKFTPWQPENAPFTALENPRAAIPLPEDLMPLTDRFRPVETDGFIRMVREHHGRLAG